MSVISVIESPTRGSNEVDRTLIPNSGEYQVSDTILTVEDSIVANGAKIFLIPLAAIPLISRGGIFSVDIKARPELKRPEVVSSARLGKLSQSSLLPREPEKLLSTTIVATLVRGFS